VLPRPTSLMITYLPIFSGSEARLFCGFALAFKRVLLKGDRVLQRVFDWTTLKDTGGTRPKL
jgi:hypothetical protein